MGGLRAVKMLGQNFLHDRGVIARIIEAVAPAAADNILEIGPGQGAITRELVASGANLVAVELDRRFAPLLTAEFAGNPRVRIVEADILEADLEELLGTGSSWKVAANLPYNISSQVLIKFLDTPKLFSRLVLMLQKEVGDRLCAAPATKEYGILTLFCSLHYDVRREFIVRPGSFHPVPKVDSAVLVFKGLGSPREDVGDERLFRRVVKAAFSQRRKTLWNCLKSAGLASDEQLTAVLASCAIAPRRRGETLSLKEFAAMTRALLPVAENGLK
ncbi:MAG: 16S rRNA (adenine(1518)-N(6)/adenine(1519)-N(6))-dimethyltransferase RsmA [Geobacter sp.]|nr:16S rRNA (adenine(1518)-N(6)/adenine(1519)-N(6))-dimethyltransferase RsmA [Geobacter sp.]